MVWHEIMYFQYFVTNIYTHFKIKITCTNSVTIILNWNEGNGMWAKSKVFMGNHKEMPYERWLPFHFHFHSQS